MAKTNKKMDFDEIKTIVGFFRTGKDFFLINIDEDKREIIIKNPTGNFNMIFLCAIEHEIRFDEIRIHENDIFVDGKLLINVDDLEGFYPIN